MLLTVRSSFALLGLHKLSSSGGNLPVVVTVQQGIVSFKHIPNDERHGLPIDRGRTMAQCVHLHDPARPFLFQYLNAL